MSENDASVKLMPQLNAIQIPIQDGFIAARVFSPKGTGSFPTVLLLHGFPGIQQNYDLAAGLQKSGYQVIVFHYRGLWGSRGNFSVVHSLEDMNTVLQFLRKPETTEEYQIDLTRFAVVGHSFGGFVALQTAAQDNDIAAVASLSGANLAIMAQLLIQAESRALLEALFEEPASFATGYSSRMMAEEILEHASNWDVTDWVQNLSQRPVLLVGAEHDVVNPVKVMHDPLVSAFHSAGATKMQSLVIESADHGYEGKRHELLHVISDWLSEVL